MSGKRQLKIGAVPNGFIYNFCGLRVVLTYARLRYGIHVKKDKAVCDMEGPMVCMANHPSFLDPFVMAGVLFDRRINIVAGAYLFRNRLIGPLFTKGGCIPKMQFRTDSVAVKAMLTVLKRNGTLGIFPEATRFVDGTNVTFDNALAKLVKKTDSAVCFIESHGAYMTWPRWSTNSIRRGRIEGCVRKAYTVEEVKAMTVDELQAVMLENLTYNEYDWLRKNPRTFKSKAIAAGAENIAYVCPRCEAENKMVSEKDTLRCTACGNRAKMDASGFFHPVEEGDKVFEDLHLWHNWERKRVKDKIASADFVFEEEARLLLLYNDYEYRDVGRGVIRIENNRIVYIGTAVPVEEGLPYNKKERKSEKVRLAGEEARKRLDNGPSIKKEFPISHIKGISVDYGKRFEITETGGLINRFILNNGQRIFELQIIIQSLKDKEPEAIPAADPA